MNTTVEIVAVGLVELESCFLGDFLTIGEESSSAGLFV